MWTIYEESLEKKFYVPILSRGFFVAAICYLIAFIVPVLILVSIGYSMGQNSKELLKPTIKYENYQMFCLLSDQSTIYDSSFIAQTHQSYQSTVSVGSDAKMYSVSAFVQGNVLSCTLLTYNRIILNDNNEILVTIPFNFYHESANNAIFVNKVTQKGKVEVFSSGKLLDTTVTFNQTSYVQSEDFSMIDNAINFSSRNLSAFVNIGTEKKTYGSSGNVQFQGSFQIQGQIFIKSQSLLNKIRSFVPFYMYLWFPTFFFVIIPLIQWMFNNKLYYAKTDKGKIKLQ